MGDSGDRTLAPLVAPLLKDPIPNVRFEAVYAVGHLKATQFGDRVESALRDEDVVVRRYAAGALAELRSTRHLKALRAALCDSDDMVRDRAKRAILLIEDPKLDPDTLR